MVTIVEHNGPDSKWTLHASHEDQHRRFAIWKEENTTATLFEYQENDSPRRGAAAEADGLAYMFEQVQQACKFTEPTAIFF